MRMGTSSLAAVLSIFTAMNAFAATEADIIGKWGASAQPGVYSCNASGDGVMRHYFSKGAGADIIGHLMGGAMKVDVKMTYVLSPTSFRGDGLTLKNKATGQSIYVIIDSRDSAGKPVNAQWRPISDTIPAKTSLWMKRCGD